MIYGIVAIDDKRGLATDEGIPWDIPEDKKYFREKTSGNAVLMGGKTYQEFAEPLPGRKNYVATRETSLRDGFIPVSDAVEFIKNAKEDIWVVGGAGLFASTWGYIDQLYVTRVSGDFNCTKFLPEFKDDFKLKHKSPDQTENGITYCFEIWSRNIPKASGI